MSAIRLSGLPPVLILAGGLAFAACQWLIYAYAPVEAQLGLMQKIFYVHLPLAWWGLCFLFIPAFDWMRFWVEGGERPSYGGR